MPKQCFTPVLPVEKCPFLVLTRNTIMFRQHVLTIFWLYYLSSGSLREVKNKRKSQTFSLKVVAVAYQWEVVPYKRFQTLRFDLETFGVLDNWSLTRGGRLQEVPNIAIWLGNCWYVEKLVAEERWSLTRGGRNRRFDFCWLGCALVNRPAI